LPALLHARTPPNNVGIDAKKEKVSDVVATEHIQA